MRCLKDFFFLCWLRMYNKDRDKVKKVKVGVV